MSVKLPDLPYALDALEPHISSKTLEFHYGKHHAGYVNNLNKLVEGTNLENESLENIIQATAGDSAKAAVFNNAAQVWNHTFYWNCMKPNGGGRATGDSLILINRNFGSFDTFVDKFKTAAVSQFGSGWAWLVMKDDKLEIMKTANADTPLAHGAKALLTVDVWEHAYYLDYQNLRPGYVETFIKNLINWDFVNSRL